MSTNLKKFRKLAGLTQRDMAKKLGYKYTSGYNQLENGKRRINIDSAKAISEILQKPMEEIFFDQGVAVTTTRPSDHDDFVKKAL